MTNRYGFASWMFTNRADAGPGFTRLRVDNEKTSFNRGRQFRSFKELSLASGAIVYARFTAPVQFVLFDQNLAVDAGGIKLTAWLDATPSGTFNTAWPILGKNRRLDREKPYYEPQIAIADGGTFTGGTLVDVLRAAVGGQGNQAVASGGGGIHDERGLPAGTYWLKFENIAGLTTSTGTYSLWWEET